MWAALIILAQIFGPPQPGGQQDFDVCTGKTENTPLEESIAACHRVVSKIDNLSLSDRRAESVAIILSDTFRVPPENLATQGYGEQYLKVPTEGPSRANRRVAVRRITPLLSRSDDYSDRSPERVR